MGDDPGLTQVPLYSAPGRVDPDRFEHAQPTSRSSERVDPDAGPIDEAFDFAETMRTYQPPTPEPEPELVVPTVAPADPPPAPDYRGSATQDGLNWPAVAQCESGGNPATNTGNGYYGLYQFSLSTWQSVGGSGLPSDASAEEQTARAQTLYQRSGDEQWPVCGDLLYS